MQAPRLSCSVRRLGPVTRATRATRASATLVALATVLAACSAPAAHPGLDGSIACPRDAEVDATGRCACHVGDLRVLGACVPPPVADAYCGRAARASVAGCAFAPCGTDEAADLDVGCVPLASVAHSGAATCPPGAALVVASGRAACVPPDAACPRGSHAQSTSCVRPVMCPPGSLPSSGTCRPIVLGGGGAVTGGPEGAAIVDIGAWATLVLGTDGGPASADLCRPLQAHPAAFGVGRGETLEVQLAVALTVPDEDLTRVLANVRVVAAHPLLPAAVAVADGAVTTLLEALRSLGGQATATRVESHVKCVVTSL